MHRLNRHGACPGEKSDILVTEQLFLKLILNFGGGGGGICNMTCATPETDVRKRTFSLRHLLLWWQVGPLVLPGWATVTLRVSWLWDNPEGNGFSWPVQKTKTITLLSAFLFPPLML